MEGYVYVDMDQKLRNLLNTIFTDEFMEENLNFDTYNSLTPNWYYKVLR